MPHTGLENFHLHLVSDATGETLLTVGRAAAAQYINIRAIEHMYPLVRNTKQLDRVLEDITHAPGIVLYTLINSELAKKLEDHCRTLGNPCISVIDPVLMIFRSYLGEAGTPRVGGQHVLNADYFKRIDALNYTMLHDDGQMVHDLDQADIVLVGISRTSKTPTSIYLANRGIRTANIPLVPDIPVPNELFSLKNPLIVGLIATPERIGHIRQNRLLSLNAGQEETSYADRTQIAQEIIFSRKLCENNNWPIIDVTRRSIEETAAAIQSLYTQHINARNKPA